MTVREIPRTSDHVRTFVVEDPDIGTAADEATATVAIDDDEHTATCHRCGIVRRIYACQHIDSVIDDQYMDPESA